MPVNRYDLRNINIRNCSILMRENTGGGASRTKGPNSMVVKEVKGEGECTDTSHSSLLTDTTRIDG
jgi:hypothetical protein